MTDESRNNIYGVPPGYFDSLRTRLRRIPVEDGTEAEEVTAWTRIRPLVALAASIAVLFVCGTFVLNLATKSASPSSGESDYMEYAYMITPNTDPYAVYSGAPSVISDASTTSEDVVNYLIETGVSLEQISYANQYDE